MSAAPWLDCPECGEPLIEAQTRGRVDRDGTGGGTDSAAYAWFVWEPGRGGRWSVLGGEVAP